VFYVRVSPANLERLRAEAGRRDISLAWLVDSLLEFGLPAFEALDCARPVLPAIYLKALLGSASALRLVTATELEELEERQP
jgi:hypothetical protein